MPKPDPVPEDAPRDAGGEISSAMGDYLKALWTLSEGEPVATGDLAAHLGVTASSVTGMLGTLKRRGLVEHRRYRGATLTEGGRAEALRLLRRHRLLETFLIERLGYTWDEVHEEAEAMEHVMSERFTERVAELLGRPSHDPHGDPIPAADGTLPPTPTLRLSDVPPGDFLRVSRLRTQEPDLLAYANAIGLRPGARVRVLRLEPLGHLLDIEVEGEERAVSTEVARMVLGEGAEREGSG